MVEKEIGLQLTHSEKKKKKKKIKQGASPCSLKDSSVSQK